MARLTGKVVLVRVDINSPLHPETKVFLDDSRLRAILPTLKQLADSKIVLLAHQSRPGLSDFTDMSSHADLLGRLLGRHIHFVPDVCGDVALDEIRSMNQGDMILLDNVRGWPEENDLKKADFDVLHESEIVQRLSSVADAYVTDAFAAAHRNSPTLSG
ncbi:MAG TPA: phosphoglycerate kinase, partial [Candidatus Poseidoniales archaeon]